MTKLDRVKASVIVCVYNRGATVVACLQSLAAMDFADFELVLVDDASTDDTPQRLLEFQRTNPMIHVTIVRNDRNRGVSGARN
ncbi:MAG: glycosyltransferase family 2 protein, partial [Planctomycetes bacterium]|nr:glycosyltransferase family 2 protein [Planctomycetota bacterium]